MDCVREYGFMTEDDSTLNNEEQTCVPEQAFERRPNLHVPTYFASGNGHAVTHRPNNTFYDSTTYEKHGKRRLQGHFQQNLNNFFNTDLENNTCHADYGLSTTSLDALHFQEPLMNQWYSHFQEADVNVNDDLSNSHLWQRRAYSASKMNVNDTFEGRITDSTPSEATSYEDTSSQATSCEDTLSQGTSCEDMDTGSDNSSESYDSDSSEYLLKGDFKDGIAKLADKVGLSPSLENYLPIILGAKQYICALNEERTKRLEMN